MSRLFLSRPIRSRFTPNKRRLILKGTVFLYEHKVLLTFRESLPFPDHDRLLPLATPALPTCRPRSASTIEPAQNPRLRPNSREKARRPFIMTARETKTTPSAHFDERIVESPRSRRPAKGKRITEARAKAQRVKLDEQAQEAAQHQSEELARRAVPVRSSQGLDMHLWQIPSRTRVRFSLRSLRRRNYP
jgi:hypothetical protein